MNIDKIFKYFVPKDKEFFPLFEKDSQNLIEGASLLKLLMFTEEDEKRQPIYKQIEDIEHEGDRITHTIFDTLNKTFITPLDRGDIHALTTTLDNVLDSINGASQRVQLYKPKKILPVFSHMADIIHSATLEIDSAIKGLRNAGNNKDKIMLSCINLNTLENRADELYHSAISQLFETEKSACELIKTKAIIEILEKCADQAEDISDTIKGILIKIA
jgi:uncharacterized protein